MARERRRKQLKAQFSQFKCSGFPKFLDLPSELRYNVYRIHLRDIRMRRSLTPGDDNGIWPHLWILEVNRQIRNELIDMVCCEYRFVVNVSSVSVRGAIWNGDRVYFRSFSLQSLDLRRHLKSVEVNISWNEHPASNRSNIVSICNTLSTFPHLRHIDLMPLTGICYRGMEWIPAKHQIATILQPLEVIRRRIPYIRITLPSWCSLSTEGLAKHQQLPDNDFNPLDEFFEIRKIKVRYKQARFERLRAIAERYWTVRACDWIFERLHEKECPRKLKRLYANDLESPEGSHKLVH